MTALGAEPPSDAVAPADPDDAREREIMPFADPLAAAAPLIDFEPGAAPPDASVESADAEAEPGDGAAADAEPPAPASRPDRQD